MRRKGSVRLVATGTNEARAREEYVTTVLVLCKCDDRSFALARTSHVFQSSAPLSLASRIRSPGLEPSCVTTPARAMPVRIRLARYGHRNLPFYRIYVADGRAPRDGRHIEIIGHYDPKPGASPPSHPETFAARPSRARPPPSVAPD